MSDEETGKVVVTVDGADYTLNFADLGPRDSSAVRRATGMSLRAIMQAARDDPDVDIIAVLVWRARVHDGEPLLTLDDVHDTITYTSDIDLSEDEEDDEEGEA